MTPGRARALTLFHFLLNRSSEREQTLVDRRRHLADEFDDALPVLEDACLPDKLIAEFVDLGLIGRGFTLQRLQGKRIGADLVRRLALLAGDALQPVQDLGALGIEGVEQAGKQQFSASGLVGGTVQIFGDRLLRFLERGAPAPRALRTSALTLASSFHLPETSSSGGPAHTAASEISGTLAWAHGQSG